MTLQTLNAVDGAADARAEFDRIHDGLWPLLNRLHGMEASRRFWGILLHRYIAKYLLAVRAGGPFGDPPDPPMGDEPVLGVRQGDNAGEARSPASPARRRRSLMELAERAATEWRLRGRWTDARSVVLGFHRYNVIPHLVPGPAALLRTQSAAAPGWDGGARQRLKELAADRTFDAHRDVLAWLPSWYVEEFRSCYDDVVVSGAHAKEFHASYISTPDERMTVARYVEAGARLTFYQHAAMYGEVPDHFMYFAETSLGDRLRTWGWRQGPKDEPFVATRLMKPRHERFSHRPGSDRILYVMIRQPLPVLFDRTIETQRRFFEALGDDARRVVIRPRVNKGGNADLQVLPDVRSRIAGLDDGTTRMADLVSGAGVVVLDMMPSTLLMECITADVPVVAIIPSGTVFTPQAAEFYETFVQAGLLHTSPEAAARFVARLDPETWWGDVRRQDWFADYCHIFCNRDRARIHA